MDNKKSQEKIVTRFAPSPTGPVHLGSARTALFNYLFSKQNKGKMILRIEDTDPVRSKLEYEKDIIDGLDWLGIKYDEFYRQSERKEVYKRYLKKMVEEGTAYISKEEPKEEGQRSEVIRFKNPNIKIKFNDLIRGEIEFDTTELGDFVVARDMESPLYHLAVAVDDFEMGVTHIIRGDDGISNTPRQILIQGAIGAMRPIYAHIPLILGPDKSKLSKRHGAVSVNKYREEGYIAEAIVNFLALLGWSPQGKDGTNEEVFYMDELIKKFDINKVQKSGAVFNIDKLNWINKQYIRNAPLDNLADVLFDFLSDDLKKEAEEKPDLWKRVTALEIERIEKFSDIKDSVDYFFQAPDYEKEMLNWKDEKDINKTKSHLEYIVKILCDIKDSDFSKESIKDLIWGYADKEGRGNVLWPFRVALSGRQKSPDPFILSEVLGKEETVKRLKNAIGKI
ncbi:MAG: glutamate--tRNA ligase [Parcubacteria group bacterium]|nr:glutamate--tRNA ligase [Parcubacteria group bacterium]MCR4342331.1 glutamate--tRNA ligase [Patescibacteria group bacterium]